MLLSLYFLTATVLSSGHVTDSPLEVGVRVGLDEGVDGPNATPGAICVGSGRFGIGSKNWTLFVNKITADYSKIPVFLAYM